MRNAYLGACAASVLSGCVATSQDLAGGVRVTVTLRQPLAIPAHRAHASFQGGRQVNAVSRYDPWCELDIRTVAAEPQIVPPGRFAVSRVGQAFIRDYDTRMPALLAGFGCADLVFKETTWWLRPAMASPVMYLRCLAPYTHCRIGPPLSPDKIQAVIGQKVGIEVSAVRDFASSADFGRTTPAR
jgi:hypothetical protein